MKKTKLIVLSFFTVFTLNANAGNTDIIGSIKDIAGSDIIGNDALNGLINGALGSDFYSSLNIDTDFFDKMKGYAGQAQGYMDTVNQLLGILGITGNVNCFIDMHINNPLKPIDLDRICKMPVNTGGFSWDKALSGKIDIPGVGTIGCDMSTSFNPTQNIDLCSISKKGFEVLRDPNNPSKGYLAGGGIIMSPQRSVKTSSGTDTLLKTESNMIEQSSTSSTFYSNGASVKAVEDAFDVNNVFEKDTNSALAETISRDRPEEYALLREYAKSDQAKKNAEDPIVGDGWDDEPSSSEITKEVTKARPDYFGLPKTNQDVADTINSMSVLLSQQFPYADFAKSLEIYLGVKYGEINEDKTVTSVPQAKEREAAVFNDFIKDEVQIESKAAIEAIDADTFTAIEKVASSSGRLTAPTQQRLEMMQPSKKLAYVALANKQYTRDALIASMAARITQFKKRIFDLRVEKTKVCASRFYDNIADSELNKIINSADALVY